MFNHPFNLLTPRYKSLGALSVFLLPLLFSAPQACGAFTPVTGTTYRLENQANGLCGYTNLWASFPLALNSFLGNPSEYLIFNSAATDSAGINYYTISSLGVTTLLQDNGTSLSQTASSGQTSQQWSFIETGGGWLVIKNRATGNVLGGNYTNPNHIDTNTAPLANTSSQKWWVDPDYGTQRQCIAVAPAYDLAAPKKIVLCSNTNLGATAAGTLNGNPITFGYQSPPSGNTTLWGQYYYTYIDTTFAKSIGAYTVSVSGFPDASFSVSNDAYRQIPAATSRLPGATIGVSDIMNGFFRGQHEQQNEQSMPMYLFVANSATQLVSGTGGPNVTGGWKDATSIDIEMGQEAISLRNLSFAVLDARNSNDAAALRSEVIFGASFFLSGIQNSDGSFPISIKPAADTPATTLPKIIMNANVGSTAKCVAGLAAASLALRSSNPTLAAQYLAAAKNGFTWVQNNPNVYIDPAIWGPGDWVGSADSILDAAIELAMATQDSTYINAAKTLFNAGQFDAASGAWVARGTAYTNQWSGLHAAIALARWTQDPSIDGVTRGNVFHQLRAYYVAVSHKIDTPFGTNSTILNAYFGYSPHYDQEALTYANLYRAVGLSTMLGTARDQYDWLAGVNPFNTSFIIGAGSINIWPQYNRPRQDSIGELVPGAWAAAPGSGPYDPLVGSIGSDAGYFKDPDYGFGEGVVGDTSFLPANMMLMDTIVNTPIINTPITNHTYQISSLNSGNVLDVQYNSLNDGASIDQYYPNGGNNQKWTLIALPGGYWEILSVSSKKCLEIPNSSTSPSTGLDQATYTGSNFQQWSITPYGDGSYELQNRGSGLAADVQGGSTAPGALVNQYTFYTGDNQRWILNASPSPVDLSSSYNCTGIAADGVPTSGGGLDGGNYTISSSQIGTQQLWNGARLNFGAVGQNNVVTAKGQAIALPAGSFSALRVLAEAVNGNATNQPVTVQYATGLPSTFTQSFSDWANPQSYSGETNVISTYRDSPSGGADCNIKIYGYTFALDNTRSVVSFTLPNNSNVKILAATLTP